MAEILDLSEVAQGAEKYDAIRRGTLNNVLIASYYEVMSSLSAAEGDEEGARLFHAKAFRISACNKIINFHYYQKQTVKDYNFAYPCNDKFCPICQKKLSHTREKKFDPVLTEAAEKYSLWLLTLTTKNARGELPPWLYDPNDKRPLLVPHIKNMAASFQKLVRYFSGNAPIHGIDFASCGYAGAIRSLEITVNPNQDYHPHYHAVVAMKKDFATSGKNYNDFSRNKRTGAITPFSDFEILIQKIWFLLFNTQTLKYGKITRAEIEGLKQGYSCTFTPVLADNWHQAFKYTLKPAKDVTIDFNSFSDLYRALKKMHCIQCYGIFFKVPIPEVIDDSADPVYDHIQLLLRRNEPPIDCIETPEQIVSNINNEKFIYISRRALRRYARLNGLTDADITIPALSITAEQMRMLLSSLPTNTDYLDGGRPVKPKPSKSTD
jgi:hypothetical protein